jgi:tRNA nucleotidyltransferase (CCA-adding enzyme)
MSIEIFEVGGSLRDELIGIQNPPDRDFCAVVGGEGGWEELTTWADASMDKVFVVKKEFLTIRGLIGKDAIDIVLCRQDGTYSDGRRPDDVRPGTLLDDLSRRDFTMNAMARKVSIINLTPIGPVIDPFNGTKDIFNGQIKCVGNTQERIGEDNLRLLRAIRFAITKDLTLSNELKQLIGSMRWFVSLANSVSQERIQGELSKMFKFDTVKSIQFLTQHCNPIALTMLFDEANIWLKPTNEKRK